MSRFVLQPALKIYLIQSAKSSRQELPYFQNQKDTTSLFHFLSIVNSQNFSRFFFCQEVVILNSVLLTHRQQLIISNYFFFFFILILIDFHQNYSVHFSTANSKQYRSELSNQFSARHSYVLPWKPFCPYQARLGLVFYSMLALL